MPIKFEHKHQQVATLSLYLKRQIRYTFFAIGLILFSIGLGVIGYHSFGNLNWVDSFHMASMILTGMGPVEIMKTNSAKIFSSIYALYSGIAFLSITAVFFAPLIHRILHLLHVEKK